MQLLPSEHGWLRALLADTHEIEPRAWRVEESPLPGGLEAAGVAKVVARYLDRHDRRRVLTFVVKRLEGRTRREAAVYRHLAALGEADLMPRLHAIRRPRAGGTTLYLEAIRPVRRWPWRAPVAAARVLERLARLHRRLPGPGRARALSGWDYDRELGRTAARTLARIAALRRTGGLPEIRRGARWVRRLTECLPELRRQLLDSRPLTPGLIHGDLHPGNVLVRRRAGVEEPVLLDWGRARVGSPLEDVSSWLQSLGAWEPEARRRHDTIFAAYLSALGHERRITPELRAAYWLAGASNALAGALAHHLAILSDPGSGRARQTAALAAAGEWLRVLRRADAVWG
jgi:aminoglycoside phosphotransferase (APT) family kinase protein